MAALSLYFVLLRAGGSDVLATTFGISLNHVVWGLRVLVFLAPPVAFLLTRPGCGGMTSDDRAWARALTAAVRRAGLPAWPVHRANNDELVVCSPDDLAA